MWLWCIARSGSTEGSGEGLGLGGFGAEPGPNRVPEKVWEALVQSQVKFSRICDTTEAYYFFKFRTSASWNVHSISKIH